MADTALLRRRNGRPQACDQCRARKVACDHTQPICNRCRKSKNPEQCTYTIVPTSRIGRASPFSRRTTQSPSNTVILTPSSTSSLPSLGTASSTPTLPGPGYLGFTSHSGVYEETRQSLSSLRGNALFGGHENGTATPVEPRPGADIMFPNMLNRPMREMCLVVLRNIPNLSRRSIPLYRNTSTYSTDGWVRVLTGKILLTCQEFVQGYGDSDAQLEELANLICRNTARPIDDEIDDWDDWAAQFTGDNLRWESIGTLCSFREIFTDDEKQTFWGGDRHGKYQSSWKHVALICMGLCIELSKRLCDGNILLLHLCFRKTIMDSMTTGDASLTCWRGHAESVALLTFLGLHAIPDTPSSYTPTLSSERKRRIFAYVYNIDKVAGCFQGRPPLLSYRYCTTPLPLDIDEDDLLAGNERLKAVASTLDADGWGEARGVMTSAKLIRARMKRAYLTDEIMEIALGKQNHHPIDTILDIKARCERAMDDLPKSMEYNPSDLDDPNLDIPTISTKALTRLEYIQNIFFIERYLASKGQPQNGELLRVSFEMVSITLIFWMHKDRFSIVRPDFEWIVMCYAAPAGGILCMELLKPTFPDDPNITRSSIIQRLSLLIGFLDWVSPDAPNGDLCASCKTVIKHVLDQALNHPAGSLTSPSTMDWGTGFEVDVDVMGNYFNFGLMDTFEWLRPEEFASSQGSGV